MKGHVNITAMVDDIEDGDWDDVLGALGKAVSDRQSRIRFQDKTGVRDDLPGKFRKDAPETSKKAALSIKTGQGRYRVLQLICQENDHDGVTREELGVALGMSDNTVRPRVRELVQMGLVRAARNIDGSVRTRKTSTGHQADVLCPTQSGQSRYLEVSRG